LFVYVDDLGWRDTGVYGSGFYETPNIDRLAAESVRFTTAYANAPNCAPSRAALMSGTYAPRTGVYTVGSAARGESVLRRLIPVENETTLSLDVITLAEALRGAGYTTGHAGKWHMGGVGHLPTDQGFDWAVAGDATGQPRAYFYPYRRNGVGIPGLESGTEGEYLPDRLTDEAIGFMTENRDRPFFMYLSHYSVHTPISAKPELIGKYESRSEVGDQGNPAYAAMIESVDEGVGRLLDALEYLDIADHTVVVFYSDNGGFGPVTSMAPLRGSKGMLYEGGIRVPLIVRWPGHSAPGTTYDVPVIGTDLYPTLLDIAGAKPPPGKLLDGVSFAALVEGDEGTTEMLRDRPLFWHFPAYLERYATMPGPWRTTPASAVRRGHYKLIHFFEDDRWELYDLSTDVSESVNLVDREPETFAELQALLRGWWEDVGAFLPTQSNPEFDAELRAIVDAAESVW
jgi:arylsulfatase A-like enzyme